MCLLSGRTIVILRKLSPQPSIIFISVSPVSATNFLCVHFVPREGFDFGNFSGYCRESEKWGAFKASCVARVLKVDREAKEIVDVDVNNSAWVDWDINN